MQTLFLHKVSNFHVQSNPILSHCIEGPSEKYKEEMKEYVKQWKAKKPAMEGIAKVSAR